MSEQQQQDEQTVQCEQIGGIYFAPMQRGLILSGPFISWADLPPLLDRLAVLYQERTGEHPNDTLLKRAGTHAPAQLKSDYTFGSAGQAVAYWSAQGCRGRHDSDVCECRIAFPCPRCGQQQTISGEDMLTMSDTGGLCNACIAGSS